LQAGPPGAKVKGVKRRPAKSRRRNPGDLREALPGAIRGLDRIRGPLFVELRELLKDPAYGKGEPAHLFCTRPRNQMRISPLEAEAIAEAIRNRPELQEKIPAIRRHLRAELRQLRDSTARQIFRCPLLWRTRCLVHDVAKPIGCLAWNPGREFSDLAWFAFARRDVLNDAIYGPNWKLRVIPLWLARVLGEKLTRV